MESIIREHCKTRIISAMMNWAATPIRVIREANKFWNILSYVFIAYNINYAHLSTLLINCHYFCLLTKFPSFIYVIHVNIYFILIVSTEPIFNIINYAIYFYLSSKFQEITRYSPSFCSMCTTSCNCIILSTFSSRSSISCTYNFLLIRNRLFYLCNYWFYALAIFINIFYLVRVEKQYT